MKCLALSAAALVALAAAAASPAPSPATPGAAVALAVEPGHEHSKLRSLGKATIGDHVVEALQEGKVEAGKEADFELKLTGKAGASEPKAIRGWIGVESARGSVKAKTHKHGDEIDLHVETPDPLPDGAKLWVEIETDAGKQTGSFDLKRD